ncbi:alpha/beta fold hydrolase [Pedobacter punctiformis]|uniref:Alpha/beta hydrolase n=1 Tax=Pedobacter punctiformis TaxID=3004097 RepID=A0ABT4L727_9SPHI|nr:alpha/beta hydrolase [Pedobacter sp. HCMS5-2]MCZ4243724.1 alpha/beta hydrolase [Pedobacter sp. HCMS5-2]
MKPILVSLYLILSIFFAKAQTIYSHAYGNRTNKAVIFIHGGPSGNSTLFEGTTAQKLADKGFYVIVYDRRGEGRSADPDAKFTYQEAFNDLNGIYEKYNLKSANIIAHSFGGLVGTLFSEKYPKKVNTLILAGALFSQQETYNHILTSVKKIYALKNDTTMLKTVAYVEGLDKNSAEYRKGCFDLAGKNGYFKLEHPDKEAVDLNKNYEAGIFYKTNIRNHNAPINFYKNEPLKNIDTKAILKKIKDKKIRLFAIYGKQDGIFSDKQIEDMKHITGKNNFVYLDNCSHYLFVDQQQSFLSAVKKWLKVY